MAILCPKCHRPFTKQMERSEAEDVGVGEPPSYTGPRNQPILVDKTDVEYNRYYKCRHCGHEWVETRLGESGA